jgi:guanylate kinase
LIVVIFGPGGVGKGTLVNRLIERDKGRTLWLSRSWTTRPRRPGERPDAYTFVDRAAFEANRDKGGFVEWDEHLGHLYGTPRVDTPQDKDLILEIDVNGAEQIRDKHPDALVILVVPPSRQALKERLIQRGDDPESVEARLSRADMEVEKGRPLADHVVVNDDLGRATEEVAGILERHRTSGGKP